jgi:hypothetical protein
MDLSGSVMTEFTNPWSLEDMLGMGGGLAGRHSSWVYLFPPCFERRGDMLHGSTEAASIDQRI